MQSLLLRFFLQTIRIKRYKILRMKARKIISFLSLSYMQISTCLRLNIHQKGPEILGVEILLNVQLHC
jgi:hypothetical protein